MLVVSWSLLPVRGGRQSLLLNPDSQVRSVLDRAAQGDPLGSSRKSLPRHWLPGELLG